MVKMTAKQRHRRPEQFRLITGRKNGKTWALNEYAKMLAREGVPCVIVEMNRDSNNQGGQSDGEGNSSSDNDD
jgi:hypothetical protein